MQETKEKVCPKCGQRLPCDSAFCAKCGTKIEIDIQSNEEIVKAPSFFKNNKRKIGIGAIIIVGILLVLFITNTVQASNLKKELMHDWSTVEGKDGSYILCILDFSENKIEYKLETGYAWMDTTVATYDYKVVSGNKIKVLRYGGDWEKFTIKFNDDKTIMTVKPALTSVDDEEQWFNFD